ncbi:hypothetical protein JTE90_016709 [Oedothorax gibbosus]|uniref:Uncharacterized protein n=1 Tax=Oedothorax gibbosus TaxID=931172 RepID=A0AAV6V4C6_9ARAC|nr:hypothetical protein JTE90_016709 [Oedothorax gibbosus]
MENNDNRIKPFPLNTPTFQNPGTQDSAKVLRWGVLTTCDCPEGAGGGNESEHPKMILQKKMESKREKKKKGS